MNNQQHTNRIGVRETRTRWQRFIIQTKMFAARIRGMFCKK
jgi:3-methyladenine DNA glycosylase Mpg